MIRPFHTLFEKIPFGIKIFGSFAILIVVALTLIYVLTNGVIIDRFNEFNKEFRLRNVQHFSRLINNVLAQQNGIQTFDLLVRQMPPDDPLGKSLVLAGPDGKIMAALDDKLIGKLADSTYVAVAPVTFLDQTQGMLLVSPGYTAPTPLESGFLNAINRTIIFGGIVAAIVGLGFALWLTRQITRPLRQLANASAKISQGELEQKVDIHSPDALGQLGDAFNTMSNKLSRSERLRRDMIADIAHELRTPLTLIQGNLQAILDGIYQPTPDKIASIHEKSLLLSHLIRDLQELSLAEAGELPLDRQKTDLHRLVGHVTETIQPQFKSRKIELLVELPAEELIAEVDPARINQVLLNLLSNAQRYTPEGGKVTVKGWSQGENILISVSDTGSGIPEKDLPNVFERFWRGDASRARVSGGSGLGLAVVKQLVEAHGGTIWAESPPGQGATFTFSLPLQPSLPAEVVPA
ncbi:HAMP domain-containing protein [Candidatus Acetothermia bacterium]|nr:HAMP domain-containing protein [Candidatus Acetothermia bacterium]MBI3644231.1 HAMP domain-containing protein [Candidatus Acetothermia bacterium]